LGSYSKNYIKIYFWKFISIVSGFLSLLIVVPHLSNDIELYGIYTFCISFTLYLSYADIGFLSAGQKYAAEEFTRGNRSEEIKILGFTGAILLLMILPFSIAMIYFSFHPELVINDLSSEGREIAGSIFLIIGILSPFQVIIQRLVQSILIIRIKDYISLRIDISFNILKIASVFFFFAKDRYLVVEYFLFISLMTVFSSLIVLAIIHKSENYDFIKLLKSIRLSKKYYIITKKLAFSSLFLTIGWLIYYELDLIVIGKWFGPHEVAIYAIGFTFLNFLRTLWNTVFSPYAQRFNHFAGNENMLEMKTLITKIIDYTFPLCILTTLVLLLGAKYIVLFWVGQEYFNSIIILQLLIIGTGFGFITQPSSYYFIAKLKYRFINILAIILPTLFFLGVVILTPTMGIRAFALSKSIALLAAFIISIKGLSLIIAPMKIMGKWIINLVIISSVLILFLPNLLNFLYKNPVKNSTQLVSLILILGIIIGLSYLVILLTKEQQRNDLKVIHNKIKLLLKNRIYE
jgi:O-antigen/teichoic acid export membrane protein